MNKRNYMWDLDENSWANYVMEYKNDLNNLLIDDCIGSCRIGELCFDILIRDYDNIFCLTFDCYVGGVNSGYGYSSIEKDYPYDYADGGAFIDNDSCTWMSFEDFKKIAEEKFEEFIKGNELLISKANEPLHVW